MIKLKLYGLFRLDCGIKEIELDVQRPEDIFPALNARLAQMGKTVEEKKLENFIVTVNGQVVKGKVRFKDGDEVSLFTAVAGG